MAPDNRNNGLIFDASPTATPLFKERALWILVMGGFFFLVYGSTNQISAMTAPHPSFFWDLERALPFIPELIVPYMSSDIVFVIGFLMAPSRKAIQKLGLRCGLAIILSACLFILMPLQFSFERPEVTGWTTFMFDALSLDQPYNQFPSLHISLGFMCWRVIDGQLKGLLRTLVAVWFVLIAASTVLVYQHHFIDVLGGIAMVFVVHKLIPTVGDGWFKIRFVTPRHLHMALRYFILSAISAIVAFNFSATWVLFAWISISLCSVSASYCLGHNGFLRKASGGYDIVTWLLFWPYLIGSWVNWRYWRSRVPLMTEVLPGVWIGARPGPADWAAVKDAKIDSVIDLVPELPSSSPDAVGYSHQPLLDIAIPAPSILEEIAQQIEEKRRHGSVYIHCALGMSRSVLAACAWLMLQGKTKEEALAHIDGVRPNRVTRPYILITLDLLEKYRQEFPPSQINLEAEV